MGESKREDDGIVTSAPSSSVGSLLTDLLSEAKKDVAAERQQFEKKLHQRESQEREALAREEARKRESMQQRLNEETRLRNQALAGAKKERPEADRVAAATAPHTRPRLEEAAALAAHAPLLAAAKQQRRGVPFMLIAAMVFVGAGLGVGGAFALTPTPRVHLPDVNAAAEAIVAQTAKAALAEGRVTLALNDANGRIKALETKMTEALAAQKDLAARFEVTQKELEETKTQLAEAAEAGKRPATTSGRGGHRGGTSTGGGLNINTGVFK